MPITTDIDGIHCTLEKLPDGCIRVTHEGPAINAMHGPATDGDFSYLVHPFQRNQFEHLNNLLPAAERGVPAPASEIRPWWSYLAGKKAVEKDRDDAGE